MANSAFITGVAGQTLNADEISFLRDARPWGFILFKRNVDNPAQVAALVSEMRAAVGWQAPVLIDQEGGRVQRLGAPHWPTYPRGSDFSALYDVALARGIEAAHLCARLIAHDLAELGIDVDCLPLADVPVSGADPIIGDRAYGTEPGKVAVLARAVSNGLLDGGVLPVLKHIPGHGRATADSHLALPVVDADRDSLMRQDFAPFRALNDLPLGMTAHVVYSAYDAHAPATTSRLVLDEVVRGLIGYDGCLMSDDVSMNALAGSIAERTAAAMAAGCDLALHCNGKMDEMVQVAAHCGRLQGDALRRADAALARRQAGDDMDIGEARARLSAMIPALAV